MSENTVGAKTLVGLTKRKLFFVYKKKKHVFIPSLFS